SASRVTTIVLDKTGTITVGEPQVSAVTSVGNFSETELLHLVASAERSSEHRVGRAVVREAEARGISLADSESFHAAPGKGVSETIGGVRVIAGNERELRDAAAV